MNKLVIVFGKTGVGKTTICEIIEDISFKNRICHIHPIADAKRFFEDHYNLKSYELDERSGKNKKVSNASKYTFQDLMVGFYHFMEEYDPTFNKPYIEEELAYYRRAKLPILITSIRKQHEVEVLKDFKATNSNYEVILLEVRSNNRGVEETSDVLYEQLRVGLMEICDKYKIIKNNGSIEDLEVKIKDLDYLLVPTVD
jgi:hypothetical protein